jgi:hypothetical protein
MDLNWRGVLAWRMRRQFLHRPRATSVPAVVRRLAGVQAQVASAAEQAVAARQPKPRAGAVAAALAGNDLVRTWAMRGTLHVLHPDDAPAFLSLLAQTKVWEKGSWQRTFVDARQLAAITEAARAALAGKVLTREQLAAAIVAHTRDESIAEHLTSGWGAVLKPLAWQGYLVNGPSEGNRVTFTQPDWPGLPEPEEAAGIAIPAYLGAYGPASADTFDQWLSRGASKRAALKGWFAALVEAGAIVAVEVEGEPAYARAEDVDGLATAKPFDEVRLLPAFDQFVLGPGTGDVHIIDAHRRAAISKAAGWISPVVVCRGRVAGTWSLTPRPGRWTSSDRPAQGAPRPGRWTSSDRPAQGAGGALDVVLFKEAGRVPTAELDAEAARLGAETVKVNAAD